MTVDGPQLFALALSLEAEGVDDAEAVESLVGTAQCSATALIGACSYAISLGRDLPYDASNKRTLDLLTRAVQHAVKKAGELQANDDPTLLQHIVDVSGMESVAPGAVASRTAELDAALDKLRASCSSQVAASS